MLSSQLTDLMPTTFRPDLGMLVSRWTRQPLSAAPLQPIYEDLATIAEQHQARYWLQDVRHREFNDPDITRWLLTTYFPAVAERLGGRLHVAYLANPALLQAIITSPGFARPEAYHVSPYVVAFFSAEGEAFGWLTQERMRDAAGRATGLG